jgi:uncharacterized protein (DUF169 family)
MPDAANPDSPTPTWTELDDRLTALLRVDRAPIAVSFVTGPVPAGVPRFLGEAPSGCSFWRLAAERPAGRSAFLTVPADHHNCPIGSYTHRIDLPAERAGELGDVLGVMHQLGYVRPEEVPSIPRWREAPTAVIYARLADAPIAPDVVVLALRPAAAMLLGEAAAAAGCASPLGPLPRPTCMAIPAAATHGATVSLGCVGNRVYTGLDDGSLYAVVRGVDLAAVVASLVAMRAANDALLGYHQERAATRSRSAGPADA